MDYTCFRDIVKLKFDSHNVAISNLLWLLKYRNNVITIITLICSIAIYHLKSLQEME